NQRIALLGHLVALALMIPLVAWLGAYGAVLASIIDIVVYRGLVIMLARRFAPVPFQDGTMFIAIAVTLAALGATMQWGTSLLDRTIILVVSCAILLAV